MKQHLLGVLAVVLALTASAFTVKKHSSAADALYWYDAETLMLISNNPSEEPPIDCNGVTRDCAYGFSQPQSQVDPSQAEQVRFKN